jgi:hypothetical protein
VPPAAEWLVGSLATATPGKTVFMLYPGKQAQGSVQELRALLQAGGCRCSLQTPELLVFDYVGLVGNVPCQQLALLLGLGDGHRGHCSLAPPQLLSERIRR